jgi:hypothetical protein
MCGRTRKTGKNRKWKLKVGNWIKEELRVHEEKSTVLQIAIGFRNIFEGDGGRRYGF